MTSSTRQPTVLYPDESHDAATVGHLRQRPAPTRQPRLRETLRALTEHSANFTRLWNSHAVACKIRRPSTSSTRTSTLELTYQAFDVRDAPGQQLRYLPGRTRRPSAQALNLLAPSRHLESGRHVAKAMAGTCGTIASPALRSDTP